MANAKSGKPHAILVPVPFQGHITPLTHLALKLASKGISVTFAQFEFVHAALSTNNKITDFDIFSEARQSGLDIRYTTIGDGFPLDFDRGLYIEEYANNLFQNFQYILDEFVKEIVTSDPISPHFLVADTNYPWTAAIAKKYNILSVSFWTEPAHVFSLVYHLDLLKQNGHFPCKDDVDEDITYVPGVLSINTRDLISYLKESGMATAVGKVLFSAFQEVHKADFVLHNTIQELESNTLLALDKNQSHYAVGPINFPMNLPKKTSLWPESDCSEWLRTKPPASVLYVSFGSLVPTTKQVIEEIAQGLRLSGVNFVWVIRANTVSSTDTDVFLDNFKNEVEGKGLIIPWCNQIAVLSDPAVGGFLTHCGWNSVVESMWFGVPMICYPIIYDQPVNRKLVVEDWKIGISLCDGKTVDREEVAEKIRIVLSGSGREGSSLQKEAKKVKEIVHNAVEPGGSMERNLDKFIQDLKAKVYVTDSNEQ